MHERPQAALFEALRQLGYRIESSNDRLPAVIHGAGRRPGLCWVDVTESSQFASALLLCSEHGGWEVELAGKNEEEASDDVSAAPSAGSAGSRREALRTGSGYAALTCKVMGAFPIGGGTFQIEPDASSGSYFWAVGDREYIGYTEETSVTGQLKTSWQSGSTVQVAHWPRSGWQIDQQFELLFEKIRFGSPHFNVPGPKLTEADRARFRHDWQKLLKEAHGLVEEQQKILRQQGMPGSLIAVAPLKGRTISRRTDLGDSIMTAIVMSPLAILPTQFTDLGRLRLQECERVTALRTELTKCGAKVTEDGDTLTVHPSTLHGAEIETYNDHRMAMCFAILGLKLPGIRLKNPACVKKTFPNFFQKLAAPPPRGLGAVILDRKSGRPLAGDDLFAH
jgi:3-phosphoshikimate 1-carboxyvinyltransferase